MSNNGNNEGDKKSANEANGNRKESSSKGEMPSKEVINYQDRNAEWIEPLTAVFGNPTYEQTNDSGSPQEIAAYSWELAGEQSGILSLTITRCSINNSDPYFKLDLRTKEYEQRTILYFGNIQNIEIGSKGVRFSANGSKKGSSLPSLLIKRSRSGTTKVELSYRLSLASKSGNLDPHDESG